LQKISPASHWYTIAPSLPLKESLPTPSQEFSSSQFSIAKTLHEAEVALYEQSEAGGQNDARFLSRVLTSGTTSDRLSALTLMAQVCYLEDELSATHVWQSSPLHNTRALTSLLTTAQKKNRDESLKGLRALVDWWVGGGAPERKLKYWPVPEARPSVHRCLGSSKTKH
jgi:ribosome biogenesis protein MAK21